MKILGKSLFNDKEEIVKLKDKVGNITTNRQRIVEITKTSYEELFTSKLAKGNKK